MTNVQKEWTEEFDHTFRVNIRNDGVEWWNADAEQGDTAHPRAVKTFIRNLLTSHNNSLVERLEGMKHPCQQKCDYPCDEDCSCECHDYFVADKILTEAQELIKNSLTKKTKP